MKRKRDTAKAKVKLRGFKRSKTLAVTEYGKDGEPKPKLYPLKVTVNVSESEFDKLFPEPNMPTVDELIKTGLAKHTEKKIWDKVNAATLEQFRDSVLKSFSGGSEISNPLEIGVDPASDSVDAFQFSMSEYSKGGMAYQEVMQMVKEQTNRAPVTQRQKSDIRPKKVPTYDPKPRKIDLE